MPRPDRPTVVDRAAVDPTAATPATDPIDEVAGETATVGEPGLAALPIAGLTRRRVAAMMGAAFAIWIVIVFARQVNEAQAAGVRVEELTAGNRALETRVAVLRRELDLIGRQRYVEQQARGYGLGTPREVAFSLADDAPPLPPDAPGSATQRVGAERSGVTPLERWLTVLFGPSD